ncbi:SMP-30/gluconolactonase/LRE family protein [Chryseobacterium sp. MP_3.2]|uniref:SMP-30/gluconolactonase/LRE family protein n=1 Tax=Chryseobacterium sp. MP_3.2 TaxID=3071712 RepID=UPI002E085812|nr:gluconolactonase [Chryseobacterium sp. MP_3.2]
MIAFYFWDWKTGEINLFMESTGRANGTYFDRQNYLITASDLNGEIWKIDEDKNIQILSKGFEGNRFNGPNDLWVDDFGGIYFTDPLYERDYWEIDKKGIADRNLYYRNINGKVTKLETFIQPNGIIGSVTLKKLFVSDFGANKTFVYDILGAGKLSEKKLFCEIGSDGMTLDREGNVYLTGNGVTIYNKKGEKLSNILVPEEWTANVTFGGENNSTLFITASKSVFTLEMNVSGTR